MYKSIQCKTTNIEIKMENFDYRKNSDLNIYLGSLRPGISTQSVRFIVRRQTDSESDGLSSALRKFRIKGNGTLNSRRGRSCNSRDTESAWRRHEDFSGETSAARERKNESDNFLSVYYARAITKWAGSLAIINRSRPASGRIRMNTTCKRGRIFPRQ